MERNKKRVSVEEEVVKKVGNKKEADSGGAQEKKPNNRHRSRCCSLKALHAMFWTKLMVEKEEEEKTKPKMTPGKYLLPYPAASDIMIFLPLWVRSCMHDTPPVWLSRPSSRSARLYNTFCSER
jgi:hypothetical protein